MLAVAWPRPFSDDEWTFEPKWDGVRGVVTAAPGSVTVHGRRGVDITARYPELHGLDTDHPIAIDGELVTMVDGSPSFERLQRRMHLTGPSAIRAAVVDVPVTFVAFDLLVDGVEILDRPVEERRSRLLELELPPPFQVGPSVVGDGMALWAAVVERGLEGIVAKRLGSRYRPGVRSPEWRKISNVRITEAIVGGFTIGDGSRRSTFGALLLGRWDGDRLRFVGSVGTGFSDADATSIRRALDQMILDDCPFDEEASLPADARWVQPTLVASIGYRDVTAAGRLRHPRWRGFTGDDPADVRGMP